MRRVLLGSVLLLCVLSPTPARSQNVGFITTGPVTLTDGSCPVEGQRSTGCVALTITVPSTASAFDRLVVEIAGSSWTNPAFYDGQLEIRASADGTHFYNLPSSQCSGDTYPRTSGLWFCNVIGLKQVEVIVTTYTSGSTIVTLTAASKP
jgi:hypothetical protein